MSEIAFAAEVPQLDPTSSKAASSILERMYWTLPEVTWIESTDAIFSNYVLHPSRLCYSRMEPPPNKQNRAWGLLQAHFAPLVRWNDI
jgi:hypothetical protein